MASLPSSSWCCCPCHDGEMPLLMRRHLCCYHDGIIALIVPALLPTLHRWCCACCTSMIVLIALTSLPSHCMGVVTVIAPAFLSPLSWHFCSVALVSLPLSCWFCYPWCAGISALIVKVSLPLLCFHCAVDSQVSLLLLSWHLLSHGPLGEPRRRQLQHQRNKSNDTNLTRVAMPAWWGQWCQHKEGDNASTIDNVSMMKANASTIRETTRLRW